MLNRIIPLILPACLACTFGCGTPAADFYVAPGGDDAWSGTLPAPNADTTDGPFATLARARDAVRALLARGPRDVTVLLRGGTYRPAETVVFGLADGAPAGRTVTYAAWPGERPVFSAGRPVTGWRRPAELPAGLPAAAAAQVWVADVSGRGAFRALFDGARRLPRARGAGFRQTNRTPRGSKSDNQTVQFPPGAVQRYRNLAGAELRIIPCFFWIMNLLPIASIDPDTRTIKTTVPGTYPLGQNGMTDRPTAWIENVVEVLDEPGEWVLDAERDRLYLWPRGDRPGAGIVAPALTELIRVAGRIDYDGPADTPVEGLVFRGLTFMHGDRLPFRGRTGWGLQHDWELFDKPTALLRFRGAARCAVERCTFTASGHAALRLDLHATGNRIVGNHIHHVGGTGVLLAGYGPGTKDVNRRNRVTNNHIHHVGREYWGSAAVFAWQSGENLIAHNTIHHLPYTAVLATGRIHRTPPGPGECSRTIRRHEVPENFARLPWEKREPYLHARGNLIAHNDIHHVMEQLGDGNCIYVSGAGAGNVVRGNYCHDCLGTYMNAVIRCDDDQHKTLMEKNIIARSGGHGEGFISKGDNDIINNVIADLRPVHRHRGYIVYPYGSIQGTTVERNILYSRRKGQILYHEGPSRRGGGPPRLADTRTDRNIYFCTRDPDWAGDHFAEHRPDGIDARSLQADPRFVDSDAGDFGFRPGSPAPGLGIEPLDAAAAGLEQPHRSRLMGKILRATISPAGRVLKKPVTLSMTATPAGAAIRYTLDGSEPDEESTRYDGPFVLEKPAVVRARAFAPGGVDYTGAAAVFTAPPRPIAADCEATAPGEKIPDATTLEDEEKTAYTARVTAETAAGGSRSLKFTDGPGQKRSYTPHVYFRRRFTEGKLTGTFAVRLDADSQLKYQWRQYEAGGYREGPTVFFTPGGRLIHGNTELLRVPPGRWVRIAVTCGVGDAATGTYTLTVSLPGEDTPRVFADLACNPDFSRLDWVGLIANGRRKCRFYVDDIRVHPAE